VTDPAGFNDGLGMAGSWYATTARPFAPCPRLEDEIDADLVVVGGGCTGLSAALEAAERGLSVVLLEGGRVGWGASGRNGGQMIPGLRKGAVELIAAFGLDRAKALFDFSLEARTLVLDRIARHGIACDLKTTGHLLGACKPRDARAFAAEAEALAGPMAYRHAAYLDAAEARAEVDTAFHGALVDRSGGHLHPLNYTLGLAEAARAAGVMIFEHSAATGLAQSPVDAGMGGARATVRTRQGAVRARHVILAGDALLSGLMARVNDRIMPVANYIVATEPLPDARALIPHDMAVSDSRFVVDYFRLTPDGRLLFGGGERYTPDPPRDIAAFVRPYLERVFPQISGVRIDHAWGGLVSVTQTRLPHVGREGEVLFAHGYSGMGVLLSTLAGRLLVEALVGETARFDLFAGLEPPAFPGGTRLRGPLHVLGMLWYALRDRL
jgi:gamma-glutamylputrescine oxidase